MHISLFARSFPLFSFFEFPIVSIASLIVIFRCRGRIVRNNHCKLYSTNYERKDRKEIKWNDKWNDDENSRLGRLSQWLFDEHVHSLQNLVE